MNWLSRVASAPISWGVSEVPNWGHQIAPARFIADLRTLGVQATELGPQGYLLADPSARAALDRPPPIERVGGFVAAVLHTAAAQPTTIATLREAAACIAEAGGRYLAVAAATGAAGYDEPARLHADDWVRLQQTLTQAQIAAGDRVTLVLHPHYGTAVQSAADVEELIVRTDLPICLDTGHLILGGADPLVLAQQVADRVRLVHLKDVDAGLAAQLCRGEIGYRTAVQRGVFRPLGMGDAPIAAIIGALEAQGYAGWYVLEQDAALSAAPPPGTGPIRDVGQSLAFLRNHDVSARQTNPA